MLSFLNNKDSLNENDNKHNKRPSMISFLSNKNNTESNEKTGRRGSLLTRLSVIILGKSDDKTSDNQNNKEEYRNSISNNTNIKKVDNRPFILAYLGKYSELNDLLKSNEALINLKYNIITTKRKYKTSFMRPPNTTNNIKNAMTEYLNEAMNISLDHHYLLSECFSNSSLLHYACLNNQIQIVNLLLSYNINTNIVNNSNKEADFFTESDDIQTIIWTHKQKSMNTIQKGVVVNNNTSLNNQTEITDTNNKRNSKKKSSIRDNSISNPLDRKTRQSIGRDNINQMTTLLANLATTNSSSSNTIDSNSEKIIIDNTEDKINHKIITNKASKRDSKRDHITDEDREIISRIPYNIRDEPIVTTVATIKSYVDESKIQTFDNANRNMSDVIDKMIDTNSNVISKVVKLKDNNRKMIKGRGISRMSILKVYNAMTTSDLPILLDKENITSAANIADTVKNNIKLSDNYEYQDIYPTSSSTITSKIITNREMVYQL
mmetsp:Transcript_25307/g.23025  ORF Transcript_25307/g.23025 Transcript_25307/m.23025 type:complete len:492 (-) Transcript_25307:598-2073(-)